MKAIAIKTVRPEVAIQIVEEIIENLNINPKNEGREYERVTVQGQYIQISPDCYPADIEVRFDKDEMAVQLNTVGGFEHSLKINVKTGRLTALHKGARNSLSGNRWVLRGIFDSVEEDDTFFNDCSKWQLIEKHTSEPSWAVPMGILRGQFGEGPINLEEYEREQAFKRLKRLNKAHAAIGLPTYQYTEDIPVKKPYTGLDYRRAGAMGITL